VGKKEKKIMGNGETERENNRARKRNSERETIERETVRQSESERPSGREIDREKEI